MWSKTLITVAAAALLGACAEMTAYEEAVEDEEPVYCYRSIGAVQCYKTPYHRDERRIVNFFGKAPRFYDRPAPPPEPTLYAPRPVGHWQKDAEPVVAPETPPQAAPAEPEGGEKTVAGARES